MNQRTLRTYTRHSLNINLPCALFGKFMTRYKMNSANINEHIARLNILHTMCNVTSNSTQKLKKILQIENFFFHLKFLRGNKRMLRWKEGTCTILSNWNHIEWYRLKIMETMSLNSYLKFYTYTFEEWEAIKKPLFSKCFLAIMIMVP